jgi:hypothetical protein
MDFEIVGEIAAIETIATGSSIRRLRQLRATYGARVDHRWSLKS